MAESTRRAYLKRWDALKRHRQSWEPQWRDIGDFIRPELVRFLHTDTNVSKNLYDKIINLTPTYAHRVLSAGMMAGITSPARRWARFTMPDPRTAQIGRVRQWLAHTEDVLFEIWARSNWYTSLSKMYDLLGGPGVATMHVEEDPEDVLRCYVFVLGEYCLATSARGAVDTMYREVSMSAAQVLERWGEKAVSERIRQMCKNGQGDDFVRVLHVVEPNTDYDERYLDNLRGMPWRSIWMEVDRPEDRSMGLLSRGGFVEFPVMAPRWGTIGSDVYGTGSPGMVALGDCKALQQYELESAKAVARIVTPPTQGPSSLDARRVNLAAGDYTQLPEGPQIVQPVLAIDPRIVSILSEKIGQLEQRIGRGFFVDLFISLLQQERSGVTAEEIRAKQQEKMLQLGPVLERLNDDLLDPAVDRAFGICLRAGLIPEPPPEVQGQQVKVEYISILAQAQKLLGTTSVERLAGFVATEAKATGNQDLIDTLDWDTLVSTYAEMLGVDPDVVRSAEAIAEIRAQREAERKAAAQGQAMATAASGARDLAGADMSGDNVLSRLIGGLGPAAGVAGPPSGGQQ